MYATAEVVWATATAPTLRPWTVEECQQASSITTCEALIEKYAPLVEASAPQYRPMTVNECRSIHDLNLTPCRTLLETFDLHVRE
jgi:hypothetical protein